MEIEFGELILEEELTIDDIIELDTVRVIIDDYNHLKNKPSINEVELVNNKQLEDLNINRLTNLEIEDIINSVI